MSSPEPELSGFAYGEQVDSVQQRSLGYRLLVPTPPEPWSAEVEALARRLQAAPYSDHWPPTDLFCSVLLADGRRLVAVARYGLADHTPSKRRGGLELVGVVGPTTLDVPAALAIYRWLQRKRATVDDMHFFGKRFALAELKAVAPVATLRADLLPVLPVRLWQDGAFLFAASAPSDPDHHLRLLEQNAGTSWQWLPLVGTDFPLATYAQRGPLIAWTPHLAGVALKIDRKSAEAPQHAPVRGSRWPLVALAGVALLLVGLLGANLWSTLLLHERLHEMSARGEQTTRPETPRDTRPIAIPAANDGRERFAVALAKLLRDKGALREGDANRTRLLAHYDRLVRDRENLRVNDDDGRLAVALLSVLAERNADHIEEVMQKALAKQGFSDRLVKLACELVREQFAAETADDK